MKSLEELNAIRDKVKDRVGLRVEGDNPTRVVVGMATSGIAAGARPVLNRISELVAEKKLENVMVVQTGSIGLYNYEPVVEVMEPGKEKVTYVNVTAQKAEEIVDLHLIKGQPVIKYTLGEAEK